MALLGFSIGPVQSFIATARTTRDLWAGSYALSWLTQHGMRHVTGQGGEIIFPFIENAPSVQSCVPNLFVAVVPDSNADRLASDVCALVQQEWVRIADTVHDRLDQTWSRLGAEWDSAWQDQVTTFFDIRGHSVPLGSNYGDAYRHLMTLMAAGKTIRFVPPHETANETRPKCSLTGVHAVMGPQGRGFGALRDWWDEASQTRIDGARVKSNERLCAISLVKRFAWSCFWRTNQRLEQAALRFEDTATIAATKWLDDHRINPPDWSGWSGQWLHWRKRDSGVVDLNDNRTGEQAVPPELWEQITKARDPECGGDPAPAYYAALMMDGDRMGDKVFACSDRESSAALSRILGKFASEVAPRVLSAKDHLGQLVYSGGDDVLAMVPSSTVLKSAYAVQREFKLATNGSPGDSSTMSAGIVVAHFREDLRFTLEQTRTAERQAKEAGRDRLCLRVLRHSGEHESGVCKWDVVPHLVGLIDEFLAGASDRWVHQLSAEEHTLRFLPLQAQELEFRRLVERSERATPGLMQLTCQLWDALSRDVVSNRADAGVLGRFCFFVKSMSFLARGRDA